MAESITVYWDGWDVDPGIQTTGSTPHDYSYYAPSTRIDSTVIRSADTNRGYVELPTTHQIDGGSFGFRTYLDLNYGNGVGTPVMGLMAGVPPGDGVSLHSTSNPFIGIALKADANSGPVTPRIYPYAIDLDGSVIHSQDTDFYLLPAGGSDYFLNSTDLEFEISEDGYLSVYVAIADVTLTTPTPLSYTCANSPTWTHFVFGPSASNAGTGAGDEPGTFTTIRSYDLHLRSRSQWGIPLPANQANTKGAVMHLPLDDYVLNDGARALIGNDGIYSGGPTLRLSGPSNVIPFAVGFDETHHVEQTGGLDDAGDSISVECWLKTTSISEAAVCGSTNDGTSNNIQLIINQGTPNRVRVYLRDGAGSADLDANFDVAGLNDGSWHHIAAVFEESSGDPQLYYDGVQQSVNSSASTGTLGTLSSWDYSLAIGARNVRGVIQDRIEAEITAFSLYNRFLTSQEIYEHYKLGLNLWETSKSPIVV